MKTRRLTSHWVLVAVLLAVLCVGLSVASPFRGVTPGLYDPQPSADAAHVPAEMLETPDGDTPVAIGRREGKVTGIAPRPHHLALTFDDGPDPTWTPAVLDVLARHHVHATFFVTGAATVRHPELVRRMAQEGHELGLHTFSHVNLAAAPPWRRRLETAMTSFVVEGAAGVSSALVRPPFSSTPSALDDGSWAAAQSLAREGYVVTLSSVDAEDWKPMDTRTATEALVKEISTSRGRGHVVLMHDGGGDRSRTVAELDQLLTRLEAQGYSAGTVSDTLGVEATSPTPAPRRVAAAAVLFGLWLASLIVQIVSWLVLAAGGVAVIRALALLAACVHHQRCQRLASTPSDESDAAREPVTVVVPAYNEEAGIEATIRSLAASTHPARVVVVDDGSSDATADIARRVAAELADRADVDVVSQPNGGKPSALNTGLAMTKTPLVVMVDGDTVFEPGTIGALVRPFAGRGGARVGAVSGNAKVANRGGILGRWQHIEYVLGFNMDRRWYDVAACMPTVPGAIGAFRTDALRSVGGIGTRTLAEDTDATMALGRAGWQVRYAPEARAWTEAPATLKALWSQRYRWSYGTMQAMWLHGVTERGLRAGGPGGRYLRRAVAYMLTCQVAFPLLAPAVDVFALYGLLSGDLVRAGAVWFAFLLVDMALALVAFRADGESPRPLWALPLTTIVYRQMMYLVVIHSLATAVTGMPLRWHRMERYGTHTTVTAPAPAAS